MKSGDARAAVISAVTALRREGLLDWTGGAISYHPVAKPSIVTPGGAARRLWAIGERDLLAVSGSDTHDRPPAARLPVGYRVHAELAALLGKPLAIVHTHAGASWRMSCRELEMLPPTPATLPLGAVPFVGLPTAEVAPSAASEEWLAQRTLPDVRNAFIDRAADLDAHGLGFVDFEHGMYAVGRHLEAALVDTARLEMACRLLEQDFVSLPRRPGPTH